ncbi:MAG: FAD-dependent oxidoreductase [Pirellulales bacterium]|nr:FAD-dependent oxidoreductase [Pirellulales bacterium]
MSHSPMKVVVIGGVAAGPKVASKVIRLRPDTEVTIVEKGEFLSYAGCGLPYYVSGVVKEQAELMSTPVGVVRDSVFFQKVKNVHVMNHTEATKIDRAKRRVQVRNGNGNDDRYTESWLGYDKLVLATGGTPVVPPLDGIKLDNIFTLHGVHDAEGIKNLLAQDKARDVVIVGGGLIGVEATEALVAKGCRVTIVEMLPQILNMLDWEIAKLVEQHMESHGVKVLTSTRVESFEGNGRVTSVVTTRGTLPADMVILSIGVRPNVKLARDAGLDIGVTGAIKVDQQMCTSDPDIFAAGDCVECTDLLTGNPCYVPLGSTANKQGRVAANNLCGQPDVFPGVLGSTVCRVFDYCIARTGLTEKAAVAEGYDVVTAMAPAPDKAHFMPEAKPLLLKLVADKASRRLLGAQATGSGTADKRIDVAAMAITARMTLDELANADLCYAPPYAPAMDNIITAANVARNKLDGYLVGISPTEVHQMIESQADFVFLDVRSPAEYGQVQLPGTTLIPLGTLRQRLGELPKDKEIITFCKISLRGYEAALILRAAGFEKVRVMDGGVAMWPFEKTTSHLKDPTHLRKKHGARPHIPHA